MADAFEGLRKLVSHGVLLLSELPVEPVDDDVTTPFLEEDELRAALALSLWAQHLTEARRPRISIIEIAATPTDAESEELTEDDRARRAFGKDIDNLQLTLSKLKNLLGADG